jgi:hypothetical protein
MNPPPKIQSQLKPSRSKHNSNHRKQRRKAAKISKGDGHDISHSAEISSSAANAASASGGNFKRSTDPINRPGSLSGGVEGIAKKKTSRGRPNRPWKPWSKLSLTDIENIAERRGNSGRGFDQ